MEKVVKEYKKEYEKFGRDKKSLFIPKDNQGTRFKSITSHIHQDGFSILDYGCGFGDLKIYLDERFEKYKYTGADIVEEFIKDNRSVYGDAEFLKIDNVHDIQSDYDYIVAAGVFNMLYVESEKEHQKLVFDTIKHLFEKSQVALSLNFLSPYVDFTQPGAFHQDDIKLLGFVRKNLSKRLVLDFSLMPYEYSITIFKKDDIDKERSIYKEDTRYRDQG